MSTPIHRPDCPGEGRGCTLRALAEIAPGVRFGRSSTVSSAEHCRRRGWTAGTVLVGDEGYGLTTLRITAIGERDLLAVGDGVPEQSWSLDSRCWGEL